MLLNQIQRRDDLYQEREFPGIDQILDGMLERHIKSASTTGSISAAIRCGEITPKLSEGILGLVPLSLLRKTRYLLFPLKRRSIVY